MVLSHFRSLPRSPIAHLVVRLLAPALAALLLAPAARAQPAAPPCDAPPIETPAGPLCGAEVATETGVVTAYLGVPYAADAGGANRFRPPVPAAPWTDVLAATAFGPECPQNRAPNGRPRGEDCLQLNLWVPPGVAAGDRAPVFVFVHGGSFVVGSTSEPFREGGPPLYDGARFAARTGAVVVTMNYRLGALGFLAGAPGVEGNMGLLDQRLALAWVRDNVAAFGGDPSLVTLAGESAGAQAVAIHLWSAPASADLFGAAVLQSAPLGIALKTEAQARAVADVYLLATGCKFRADTLGCLQAAPLERLLAAQANPYLPLPILHEGLAALLNWTPVVDGDVVVRQPLVAALAEGADRPLLIGTNRDEGDIFFAGAERLGPLAFEAAVTVLFGSESWPAVAERYPPSRDGAANVQRLADIATAAFFTCPARAAARNAQGAAYLYAFTHVPTVGVWANEPRCADRSCHGDELPFVFGTAPAEGPFAPTPDERELSASMMRYWGRFAGPLHDPDLADPFDPLWPAAESGELLELAVPIAAAPAFDATCAFWEEVGSDLGLHLRVAPPAPALP